MFEILQAGGCHHDRNKREYILSKEHASIGTEPLTSWNESLLSSLDYDFDDWKMFRLNVPKKRCF